MREAQKFRQKNTWGKKQVIEVHEFKNWQKRIENVRSK